MGIRAGFIRVFARYAKHPGDQHTYRQRSDHHAHAASHIDAVPHAAAAGFHAAAIRPACDSDQHTAIGNYSHVYNRAHTDAVPDEYTIPNQYTAAATHQYVAAAANRYSTAPGDQHAIRRRGTAAAADRHPIAVTVSAL